LSPGCQSPAETERVIDGRGQRYAAAARFLDAKIAALVEKENCVPAGGFLRKQAGNVAGLQSPWVAV
jgi:hypothetical protein